MENRILDDVSRYLVATQQCIAAGYALAASFPSWLADIYYWVKIVAFDWSFIRPRCIVGKVPYPYYYLATLICILLVFLFNILCALFYQFHKRKNTATKKWISGSQYPRVKRALTITFYITYLEVCKRTMWIFHCIRADNDKFLLMIEPSIICYENRMHLVTIPLAFLVLVFYCIGLPIFLFLQIRKHANSASMSISPTNLKTSFQRKYGFLYEKTLRECYWFRMFSYPSLFIISITTVFIPNIKFKFPILVIIFSVFIAIVCYFWPMHNRYENQFQLVVGNIKLGTLTLVMMYSDRSAPILVSGICGILVMISSIIYYCIHPPPFKTANNMFSFEMASLSELS